MRHFGKAALALLLFVAGMPVGGCASESNQAIVQNEKETVTFQDDLGRDVTVSTAPKKIAALIGSFADMVIDAGGQDSLVAAAHDTFTTFGISSEGIADLGDVKEINMEALLESEPDFVIASAKNESQKELLDTLDAAGIPVAYFDVSNFDDYLRVLKILTSITTDEQAYAQAGTSQEEQIDSLIEQANQQTSKPSVLYLRATGKGISALGSDGSVLGEILKDLNTTNVADGSDLLDSLSMEEIIEKNPEKIFLVFQGSDPTAAQNAASSLLNDPAWQSLQAVQNDQVYTMDQRLFNVKPNDQWAEAYQQVYDILYGE